MFADLIIASVVLLLAAAQSYQARVLHRVRRALARELADRARLDEDLQALLNCSRALGARFQQQSELQHSLSIQIRNLARQPTSGGALPDAQRLLSEGLQVEQVATLCELSQGEAELLVKWRQRQRAA
ncbi:MAG: DUF2802 domain-containing protein [Gammaproteobacteria bacterium]